MPYFKPIDPAGFRLLARTSDAKGRVQDIRVRIVDRDLDEDREVSRVYHVTNTSITRAWPDYQVFREDIAMLIDAWNEAKAADPK